MGGLLMDVAISTPTMLYATHVAALVTPPRRTSGFADAGARGAGDYLDALGSLVAFEELARAGRQVSADFTAGRGDDGDLSLDLEGHGRTIWNVKASAFAPFSPALHLFVKEEEAHKPVMGFVQVFVHLNEDEQPAHAHIAGICSRERLLKQQLREIPKTGGHMGYGVPVRDLKAFDDLILMAVPSVFWREVAA